MRTRTRAFAAGVWLACACGPAVGVDPDGSDGGNDDELTSTSGNETASSDSGPSTSTATATATATTPTTTTFPTTAGTDDTGGSSTRGEVSCAEIDTESLVCMFVDVETVHLVGMDTGRVCEYVYSDTDLFPNSLVWIGDEVHVCNSDHSAFRLDLDNGSVTPVANACEAASRHSGGILVKQGFPNEPLRLYASIDDFVAENVAATFDVFPHASRIASADDDALYGAWHSTEHLEVWDVPGQVRLDDLWLGGYDGRVNGLAVVDDLVLVLGEPGGDAIMGFDRVSGEQIVEVALADTSAPGGLACR